MTVEEAWRPPERPWFRLGRPVPAQEEAIREYAQEQGFKNLRGFWKWMESKDWDYYDILQAASP